MATEVNKALFITRIMSVVVKVPESAWGQRQDILERDPAPLNLPRGSFH